MVHLVEVAGTIQPDSALVLNADELNNWVESFLQPLLPGKHISILPSKYGACKGESQWFCSVDVEDSISLKELIAREVKEFSRGDYVHFYVDDILSAATKLGQLTGSYFLVWYKW